LRCLRPAICKRIASFFFSNHDERFYRRFNLHWNDDIFGKHSAFSIQQSALRSASNDVGRLGLICELVRVSFADFVNPIHPITF
jgi:hypothetical protein